MTQSVATPGTFVPFVADGLPCKAFTVNRFHLHCPSTHVTTNKVRNLQVHNPPRRGGTNVKNQLLVQRSIETGKVLFTLVNYTHLTHSSLLRIKVKLPKTVKSQVTTHSKRPFLTSEVDFRLPFKKVKNGLAFSSNA